MFITYFSALRFGFPLIMAKIARCVDQYLFLNLFVFNNPLQPLFKDDIEGIFLILFFWGRGVLFKLNDLGHFDAKYIQTKND